MTRIPAPSVPGAGCWSRIGVSGDRSCAELERHIHCRNCPAYADGAQRSLQRPIDPGYRQAWATRLRTPQQTALRGDASAVVFRVGPEWLALPTSMAVSVAPLAPLHRIPHRSARGLLGVVNIGGRLAPAVSLGALLGIDEQHAPAVAGRHVFARLLVIAAQGQSFALPVAELRGVERYAAATLLPPAATVARIEPGCLAGVLALPAMQAGLLDGALLAQRLAGLLR